MTELPIRRGLAAPVQRNFDALADRLSALEAIHLSGSGSPNGAVAAAVGTLYLRTDGGASTTLYVKETGGSTDTGWAAK